MHQKHNPLPVFKGTVVATRLLEWSATTAIMPERKVEMFCHLIYSRN
jgi:hypothetical protein